MPRFTSRSMSVIKLVTMVALLVAWLAAPAQARAQNAGASAIDRELVVRFTRAYGMAREAFDSRGQEAPSVDNRNAMLRHPDELDDGLRRELLRILDLNGLDLEQWRLMLARMETDEDLRQRVESLAVPFE